MQHSLQGIFMDSDNCCGGEWSPGHQQMKHMTKDGDSMKLVWKTVFLSWELFSHIYGNFADNFGMTENLFKFKKFAKILIKP